MFASSLSQVCLFGLKKASVEGTTAQDSAGSLLVATVLTERDKRQGGFQPDLQSQPDSQSEQPVIEVGLQGEKTSLKVPGNREPHLLRGQQTGILGFQEREVVKEGRGDDRDGG